MFSEQFAFQDHALVNFVGGGGKTALIHKLMEEYSAKGPVLCMTTTRVHPPEAEEGFSVISGENLPLIQKMLEGISRNCAEHPYKILVSRHFMSPHLMKGVSTDFINALDRSLFPIFLNEADGAAGFSLKLPRENEPVLMKKAEYLVPIIGLDCLGQPGADAVFRWQEHAEDYSLRAHEVLTPQLAAAILMHPRGVCKDWEPGVTIVPFINKVDSPSQESMARDLADCILHTGNYPVDRVLYGSVLEGTVESISGA